jgi:hypothetical protein
MKLKKYYSLPFPNFLRTKEQRRVRYCFLRQSGLPHLVAERVVAFRDSKQIQFLENLNKE